MSNNNNCSNCRFYVPYYKKGQFKFEKLDIGSCAKTKSPVEKHNGCESFSNRLYARINRRQVVLTAIAENINLLAEMKQILEEDDSDAIEELIFDYKRKKNGN